ncbi:uncharacterized protein GGS22DRAFT_12153 [Annulohypoxylon maeteangense]|uniref:uncharacterized protein n=1 Tax=Annulohypoxylon maeteangense TaxID=1927788 RepID=UPI0020089326|nr:uncharacterized protein GGS22DRAFT_12153 [Annulohypoxylon maeteangense]KAI0890333.1 hypothetical protein GGS22DRAFT_12153 [Annulohypoxylon maeteangense]
MASRNTHLDATVGREVVFCHNCRHEWYRDERPDALDCPRCRSDIIEIVEVEHDPRIMDDDRSLPDLDHLRLRHHHHRTLDSDDEDDDDLEENILHGPGGFFSHRTIYRSPERQSTGNGSRAAPENTEQIIRTFTELLGNIGGPNMRSGPDTVFSSPPQRVTFQRISGPGFQGGMSSITFSSTSARNRADPGQGGIMGRDDPFRRVFGDIMGDMGPPTVDRDDPNSTNQNGDGNGNVRPQADFSLALSQLIASLINPQMVHGDAVYSQEALDRIITNLMDSNPQSNAPAPASDESIAGLPRKKLDEAMLGPELKGECTICIDEMTVGDEAVVLPCRHWFHEQCVTLWLKQHNTCPICRAAIDGEAAGRPNEAVPPTQPGPSGIPSHYRRSAPTPPGRVRSDLSTFSSRQQSARRDSNSPPTYSGSSQPNRARSPSPSRRSAQSDRARDARGSSGGPFNWIRDQFRGDRR